MDYDIAWPCHGSLMPNFLLFYCKLPLYNMVLLITGSISMDPKGSVSRVVRKPAFCIYENKDRFSHNKARAIMRLYCSFHHKNISMQKLPQVWVHKVRNVWLIFK